MQGALHLLTFAPCEAQLGGQPITQTAGKMGLDLNPNCRCQSACVLCVLVLSSLRWFLFTDNYSKVEICSNFHCCCICRDMILSVVTCSPQLYKIVCKKKERCIYFFTYDDRLGRVYKFIWWLMLLSTFPRVWWFLHGIDEMHPILVNILYCKLPGWYTVHKKRAVFLYTLDNNGI